VADPHNRSVPGRVGCDPFCIIGKLPLSDKNRRDALTPDFLDHGKYPQLVVHQGEVSGRVAPLDDW
jgi:hypothetical protein